RPITSIDAGDIGAGTFFGTRRPSISEPLVDPRSKYAVPFASKRMSPCHSETNGSDSTISFWWFRPIRMGDCENSSVRVVLEIASLTWTVRIMAGGEGGTGILAQLSAMTTSCPNPRQHAADIPDLTMGSRSTLIASLC